MTPNTSNGLILMLSLQLKSKLLFTILVMLAFTAVGQSQPAAERHQTKVQEVVSYAARSLGTVKPSFQRKADRKSKVSRKLSRNLRKTDAKEWIGGSLFFLGLLITLFGAISVIWFSTIGAWIFLIALGIQIVGITLTTIGLGIATDWDGIGVAIGFGIPTLFTLGSWVIWGIIGLLVWLI